MNTLTEFGGEASRGVMVNKTTQHRLSLIREFTAKYRARIVHGLAIYGEFDPATDNRILAYEALEECLDIGEYLEMLEEKHEVMGPKIRPIMSKTILLYGDLKALVQEESSRTRERGSAA